MRLVRSPSPATGSGACPWSHGGLRRPGGPGNPVVGARPCAGRGQRLDAGAGIPCALMLPACTWPEKVPRHSDVGPACWPSGVKAAAVLGTGTSCHRVHACHSSVQGVGLSPWSVTGWVPKHLT